MHKFLQLAACYFALFAGCPTPALCFTVDGFSSGMSREDVTAVANRLSLDSWDIGSGNMAIGKRSEYRVEGTFAFCEGHLFAYSRNIDFDADYYQVIQGFLVQYKQPIKVATSEQIWTGPGGGFIRSVKMVWRHGEERIDLDVAPEGRDGTGALRYTRSASVSYTVRTKCSSAFVSNP